MTEQQFLEHLTGERWTGVRFLELPSPDAAMRLLRCWQQMMGRRLATRLSGFTAVCASLVAAHQEGQLVFSFGCPDSRRYGGIGPDRLVAALPREVASQMMQEIEDHANV